MATLPSSQIKAFAPATVANVACGFDVLGFALQAPGDTVVATRDDAPGVRIGQLTGDEGRLPREAEKNTAGIAVAQLLAHLGLQHEVGITLELHKDMPLGSGLGSSAASAVAAVVAANELLGTPLSRAELLPFAMEGERIACGAAHADNAGPSLLGGFVLIRSYEPLDCIALPVPSDLFATVVHPHVEVQTRDAREVLRRQIPLKAAITQWGNVGGLVAGLYRNDYELIGRSLHDAIIEPIRSLLIPGFTQVRAAALASGVLGFSISGSGPSLFALSQGEAPARQAAEAMASAFAEQGINSDVFVSSVNPKGAQIL